MLNTIRLRNNDCCKHKDIFTIVNYRNYREDTRFRIFQNIKIFIMKQQKVSTVIITCWLKVAFFRIMIPILYFDMEYKVYCTSIFSLLNITNINLIISF
jgi:hypothetical protein